MSRMGISVTAIALATVIAGASNSQAQQRPGHGPVAVPHAAPAVPHISAAPHVAAPAPHISVAPHIAAPHIAPRIAATPHMAPHIVAPRTTGFARSVGHPNIHGSGYAATARAHAIRSAGHAPTVRSARTPTHGLAAIRSARVPTHTNAKLSSPTRSRTVQGPNRATIQSTARTNPVTGRTGQVTARTGPGAVGPVRVDPRNLPGRVASKAGFAAAGFHGRVIDRDNHGRHFWERFRDRDRDFARRRFHDGFVGWIGPVFWPYAEYDIVDYALWPYDYGPLVYAYGPEEIYDSVFWPYGSDDVSVYGGDAGPSGRSARAHRGARAAAAREARVAPGAGVAQVCAATDAAGIADWPIRQIEQTVQPNQDQRRLLDDLAGASRQAVERIRDACPKQPPATPVGRLAVMESRLAAMREAVDIVRPALVKLYDALDDEQKARFNAMGKPADGDDPSALARDCADQAARVPQWPVDQMTKMLRLSDVQRAKLEAVSAAARKAADTLKATCPTEMPATPPGRLDAVAMRLDTLLDSAKMVRERLEVFYGSLSDEQKARFNTIGSQLSRQQS
jgi:hypothetical protein